MAVSLKELGRVFFVIYFSSCQFYSSVEPPKPSIHQAYLSECNFQADSKKHFFDQFQDEYLIEILRLAVKNNQDLQIALERIHEAEFFYGVEASKSYPSVSVDVDAQRTRSSKSGFSEIQGTPFALGVGANKSVITNIFLQAFNLNWEIDFFARIRNQKQRAHFQIKEIKAYERGVYLTLVSDVAMTYFSLQAYRELISLTDENLKDLEGVIDFKYSLYQVGLNPHQLVWDVEKQIAELKQVKFDLEKTYQIFYHHLAKLLGEEPSNFHLKMAPFKKLNPGEVFLKANLPSDLLKNRPDLLMAENQLIQSGYSVKIATANLFPTISLLGAFGFASGLAPTWFTHSNSFWSLGPSLRWPAFQGFQFLSQLKVEKSKQKQAALHYESTLYSALEDVENCLVTFFKQGKSANEAAMAFEHQQKIFLANKSLMQVGLKAEPYFLSEKIQLQDQNKKMIVEQFKTFQALVQLYKAFGGEWR